jgi:hypothetical protein
LRDPTSLEWEDDPGCKWWVSFMDKYYPDGDKSDLQNVYGPLERRHRRAGVESYAATS